MVDERGENFLKTPYFDQKNIHLFKITFCDLFFSPAVAALISFFPSTLLLLFNHM